MTTIKKGIYNAICDVCGFKYRADQLKMRWDGFMVCSYDWETRNPQDFVRVIPDSPKLPFTRPDPTDDYSLGMAQLDSCTVTGYLDIADLGTAGCIIIGRTF